MASNSSKTAHVMNLLRKNQGAAAPAAAPAKAPAEAPVAEQAAPPVEAPAAKQPAPPAETPAAKQPAPSVEAPEAKQAAPTGEAQQTSAPAAPAPAAPAAPAAPTAPAAPVAPIISSLNEDAAVSSQIKDALEAELAEETAVTPPAEELLGVPVAEHAAPQKAEPASVEPAAAKEAPPAKETAPVEESVPIEEKAPVEKPSIPQAELEEPEAVEETSDDTGFTYINVMQTLVDEKADKYMEMFGICLCDRCKADVRAYTLNHLPPKYVLLGPREIVPRLTVYENKYSSDIVAQLINACKIVMNTPHHTR